MLIDTATDDPAHIYAQAKMLLSLFECVPVKSKEAGPQPSAEGLKLPDSPPPPPPPPPPTSVVPVAATNTANATAGVSSGTTTLVDSAGVEWNAKLHTSTKTKDIDGKWKARKPRDTTPPAPPAQVPAGTSAPPPPPPPASMSPPAPPPPPSVMVPSTDDNDIEVETDTNEPVGVPQGAAPVDMSFADFIARLTSGMNDGSITQLRVAEVQKQLGIVALFSLGDAEASKLQDAVKAFGFTL